MPEPAQAENASPALTSALSGKIRKGPGLVMIPSPTRHR